MAPGAMAGHLTTPRSGAAAADRPAEGSCAPFAAATASSSSWTPLPRPRAAAPRRLSSGQWGRRAAALLALQAAAAAGELAASPAPSEAAQAAEAAEFWLPASIDGFRLAGHGKADLRSINGGSRCPGPSGSEPSGYSMTGDITIEDCALIAKRQPNVKGFRWGTQTGLMESSYRRVLDESFHQAGKGVPLSTLFPGRTEWTCFVYMADDDGNTPEFERATLEDRGLQLQFQPHEEEAERRRLATNSTGAVVGGATGRSSSSGFLDSVLGLFTSRRRIREDVEAMPTLHSGREVCLQRWSVIRWFNPTTDALWFCYMPDAPEAAQQCNDAARKWDASRVLFYAGSAVLGGCLAWILHERGRERSPLVPVAEWAARYVLCMELAIVATAWLIDNDYLILDRTKFSVAAALAAFVGLHCVMIPVRMIGSIGEVTSDYSLRRGHIGRAKEVMRTSELFLLLMIIYSPCLFLQQMTFFHAFPLLMFQRPLLIGFFVFVFEVVRHNSVIYICGASPDCTARAPAGPPGYGSGKVDYTPMMYTSNNRV